MEAMEVRLRCLELAWKMAEATGFNFDVLTLAHAYQQFAMRGVLPEDGDD